MRLAEIQSKLTSDYEHLIKRAKNLTRRSEVGSGILVSQVGVLESSKPITQAEQVNKLTRLALVFIPMSFVASLFGMNVSQFQPNPSMWMFFAVSVPLSLFVLLVASWTSFIIPVSYAARRFRNMFGPVQIR